MDLIEAIENNNFLKVKSLLNEGIDLNEPIEVEEDDEIILSYAIKKKVDLNLVKLLIESGADINYKNKEGVGIVDDVIICDNLELLKYLSDKKGLDVTVTNRKSRFSPLMQAACYNNYDIVKFLLEKNADYEERDGTGMTVIDYTRKMRLDKMRKFLEEEILKN